jgi:CRP-like cAMP-binding protein
VGGQSSLRGSGAPPRKALLGREEYVPAIESLLFSRRAVFGAQERVVVRKVLVILAELSDTDADWLATHGERRHLAPGTLLIQEGAFIDSIYVILEGSMSVLSGAGAMLAEVGAGEVLGEMSLIDSSPAAASIRVNQASLVLAIPKSSLQGKLQSDTAFAARFYRALCMFMATRIRGTIRRMGYGDATPAAELDPDELDVDTLGRVHLAGARFERMLKRLAGV